MTEDHSIPLVNRQILSVLVTCGGSFQGLTVVKGLRELRGVRIVVADCYPENVSRYFADRLVQTKSVHSGEAYIESLMIACDKEDVGLVIPATAHDLLLLSEKIERFSANGVQVAVSPFELTSCLLNKSLTHEWLVKRGLPTLPRFTNPTSDAFPMLGKVNESDGAKGQIALRSIDEFHRRGWTDLPEGYLWEPFIDEFEEYSIDFAIGFDGERTPLTIRSRESTIVGFAVVCDTISHAAVSSLADDVSKAICDAGGVGIFNFQIMSTKNGLVISDVNPRVGTSSVHTLATGINLTRFLCHSVPKGARIDAAKMTTVNQRVRMVRSLEELWIPRIDFSSARGLVFDLDDTLIDQRKWMFAKIDGLAATLGNVLSDPSQFVAAARQCLEEGNRKTWINEALRQCGLPESMAGELIEYYKDLVPAIDATYADVPGALAELARRGFRMGVLTNNPARSQEQKISSSPAISTYMDSIVYAHELGYEKPEVEGFVEVARRLGLPESSLLMVGDNPYRDVVGSRKAGFMGNFVIARSSSLCRFEPPSSLEETRSDQADLVEVADLRQLLSVLHSCATERSAD